MRSRLVIASSASTLILVMGCLIPSELENFSGGAADGGRDALDGASAEVGADARLDSGSDASGDAALPCSNVIVAGSDSLSGVVEDALPATTLDAYGYVVRQSGVARCARLYFPSLPPAAIVLGIYANSNGPTKLIGRATIKPAIGWSEAVLDAPVTLTSGETVWLGVFVGSASASIEAATTCPNAALRRRSQFGSVLPDPFGSPVLGPNCDAALYLTL